MFIETLCLHSTLCFIAVCIDRMQLNNFIKFSKSVKLCGKDAEEFEIARYWIF